jgi:predicted DNA binding CopG/RHH family protein
MKHKLDHEEQDILDKFENNDLKQVNNIKDELKTAKNTAKSTVSKSKHISIRLSEKDLHKLKIKAIENGIPYQTLVGALIHQYAEDKINLSL